MKEIFDHIDYGLKNINPKAKIYIDKDENEIFINIENTIFIFQKTKNPKKISLEFVDKDTNDFVLVKEFSSENKLDIILEALEYYFKFFILSNIEVRFWNRNNV